MKTGTYLLENILRRRWLSHLLFWAIVLFIAPITSNESVHSIEVALLFRAVGLPIKMAATYLLAYYQFPLLWQKRKYLLFGLSMLASILVFTTLYRIMNIHIAERLVIPEGERESVGQILAELDITVLYYLGRVYAIALLFLFIKLIRDQGAEKRKIEQLKQDKTVAELNFLKAQIHPHFLFNTLNNLYALTLTKSDQAPEVVAKLSEILDYMLYQGRAERVKIGQEIALLENYVALERIRYSERLKIDLSVQVDDQHILIAPLILISMVENAFKHGVSSVLGEAKVSIQLKTHGNELHFSVYNTKAEQLNGDEMNYRNGIGLKNARRQLALLYPGKHELNINECKEAYKVQLRLW